MIRPETSAAHFAGGGAPGDLEADGEAFLWGADHFKFVGGRVELLEAFAGVGNSNALAFGVFEAFAVIANFKDEGLVAA